MVGWLRNLISWSNIDPVHRRRNSLLFNFGIATTVSASEQDGEKERARERGSAFTRLYTRCSLIMQRSLVTKWGQTGYRESPQVLPIGTCNELTYSLLFLMRRIRKIIFAAIFFSEHRIHPPRQRKTVYIWNPLRYRLLNFRRSSVANVTKHRSRLESPCINSVPQLVVGPYVHFLRWSALWKRLYWFKR